MHTDFIFLISPSSAERGKEGLTAAAEVTRSHRCCLKPVLLISVWGKAAKRLTTNSGLFKLSGIGPLFIMLMELYLPSLPHSLPSSFSLLLLWDKEHYTHSVSVNSSYPYSPPTFLPLSTCHCISCSRCSTYCKSL